MGPTLNKVEAEGTGGATTYFGCRLKSQVEFGGEVSITKGTGEQTLFLKIQ